MVVINYLDMFYPTRYTKNIIYWKIKQDVFPIKQIISNDVQITKDITLKYFKI